MRLGSGALSLAGPPLRLTLILCFYTYVDVVCCAHWKCLTNPPVVRIIARLYPGKNYLELFFPGKATPLSA